MEIDALILEVLKVGMGVLIGIGGAYYQYKLKKKNVTLEQDASFNEYVSQLVEECRKDFGADRVMLYRFHNGGKFLDGIEMKKISCAFESTAIGVSSESQTIKDLLISAYHYPINILVTYGHLIINDIEKIPDDSYKFLLKTMGVKSALSSMIKTPKGSCIGILSVQFLDPKTFEEAEIAKIDTKSKEIGGIFGEEFYRSPKKILKLK